jgi:hypothetical protein
MSKTWILFESTKLLTRKYFDLSYTIGVTLVKFRPLLDVRELQNSIVLGEKEKVPQELLDNIRRQLVSTIVAGNKEIIESKDHTQLIKTLESQVEVRETGIHRIRLSAHARSKISHEL